MRNRKHNGQFDNAWKARVEHRFNQFALIVIVVAVAGASWTLRDTYNTAHAETPEPVVKYVIASSTMPIMLQKICKAESGNKQFNSDGSVFRGIVNRADIGYCMINEPINNDYARKLGYDIYTEQGNKDFATILFNERGVQPWEASKCTTNGWGWKLGYCK